VVTIRTATYLILGMIMLAALAAGVSAAGARGDDLLVSNVDVKIGSKTTKSVDQGETVSREAVPGDKVEIKIEFLNNLTSDEDLDIEDVDTTVTIEGIDDGDDLEEDLDTFDIRAGSHKKETVTFTLPLEVGEGTFDVTIDAEGEDENGTTQSVLMTFAIEVQKEKHELRIVKADLAPSTVSCNRNAQLAVDVLNTGQEDEEDNTITVTGSDFGVDFKDTYSVYEGEFDDDMHFTRLYSFTVPKDVAPGSYPIAIKSTFDDGRKSVSKSVDMAVQECVVQEKPVTPPSNGGSSAGTSGTSTSTASKPSDTTTVVVTQPSSTGQTTAQVIQPTTVQPGASKPTATASTESLFDSPMFLIGIIIVEVLIVVVGIAFVAYLMRRG